MKNMKKIITFTLCLSVILSLTSVLYGCSFGQDSENDSVTVESLDNLKTISGTITSIDGDDTLTLAPDKSYHKSWGNSVSVRTSNAKEFCVGDKIFVNFSLVERYSNSDNITIIAESADTPTEYAKPIIYLYPESPTECSVKLHFDGELTHTYPQYTENGWNNFVAYPDGRLVFEDGKEYYCLFWEGLDTIEFDRSKGFCVSGDDTVEFLESSLARLGLNRREINEFIIYWLPLMQDNPYNIISFHTESYAEAVELEVSPKPDSVIRIFMTFSPSDGYVEIEPQELTAVERKGFTLVEWGGGIIEK